MKKNKLTLGKFLVSFFGACETVFSLIIPIAVALMGISFWNLNTVNSFVFLTIAMCASGYRAMRFFLE